MPTLPPRFAGIPIIIVVLAGSLACGAPEADPDAGRQDAGPDAAIERCERDGDCGAQDAFCTEWRCRPGEVGADARGCIDLGSPCAAGQECDEDEESCGLPPWCTEGRDGCLEPGNCDGDDDSAMECGGTDCNDEDGTRHPGNPEVCDAEGHDEDCIPTTFGELDADGDGARSSACCNGDVCGADCDDTRREVFPAATEVCNAIDDDCDGEVDETGAFCPIGTCVDRRCRAVGWERVYGSASLDTALKLAIDGTGNVYTVIRIDGSADLDRDGSPEAPGTYLLSLTADGRHRWQSLLATGFAADRGLAFDAVTDAIVVTGSAEIRWLSPADGSPLRTIVVEQPEGWDAMSLRDAVWAGDSLYVAGTLTKYSPISAGSILLRVDGGGAEIDRRVLGVAGSTITVSALAASSAGVVAAGRTVSPMDVGGGATADGRFLLRLDESLDTVMTVNGIPAPLALALAESGDMAIAGTFVGTYTPFWGGPTWNATSSGETCAPDNDAFVVVLAADGSYRWHRIHDGPDCEAFVAVDFDERGGVMVSGYFSGSINLEPRGIFTATGELDAFFGVFDVLDGARFVVDARHFAGVGRAEMNAAAVDTFGSLIMLGTFQDSITLPSGTTYRVAGTRDVFITKVSDIP